MYPLGSLSLDIHQNPGYIPDPDKPGYLYDYSHHIPDPDRPGKMKYNPDYSGITEYEKLVRQEAQKRIEIMTQIMKSRCISYDLTAAIEQTRQKCEQERAKENAKPKKSYQELIEEARQICTLNLDSTSNDNNNDNGQLTITGR
jgi:hypothetical protein